MLMRLILAIIVTVTCTVDVATCCLQGDDRGSQIACNCVACKNINVYEREK